MSCGCGKKAVASPPEQIDTGVTLEQLAQQAEQLKRDQQASQRNALSNSHR